MAVKVDTRLMIDRAYLAAKRSGIDFNVATIPASFNAPSRGPFDPEYMSALFQTGYEQGRGANAIQRPSRRLSRRPLLRSNQITLRKPEQTDEDIFCARSLPPLSPPLAGGELSALRPMPQPRGAV